MDPKLWRPEIVVTWYRSFSALLKPEGKKSKIGVGWCGILFSWESQVFFQFFLVFLMTPSHWTKKSCNIWGKTGFKRSQDFGSRGCVVGPCRFIRILWIEWSNPSRWAREEAEWASRRRSQPGRSLGRPWWEQAFRPNVCEGKTGVVGGRDHCWEAENLSCFCFVRWLLQDQVAV